MASEILNKLYKWYIPKDVYRSILHEEFTFAHVLFKQDKVYKVIDWDGMNRSYSFQDIALPLVDILLDYGAEYVKIFLEAYEKERPLTKWEKENIDNILLLGAAIHTAWTAYAILDGDLEWSDFDKEGIRKIINREIRIEI